MHGLILVTLEITEVQEDPKKDQQIAEMIEELSTKSEKSVLDKGVFSEYNSLRNSFSRYVDEYVSEIMEAYSTEDPECLEFYDKSEEVCKEYESRRIDCFLLPEGTIVNSYDSCIFGHFKILDGKVYEANCGPLKQWKRSKRAKRIKALVDYPIKKVYSSIEEFAEKEYGYIYEESTQKYGYYHNPKAFFDWYTIGGRWSHIFLVKQKCKEYSIGDSHQLADRECPKGYKWVCAARKKDIEWEKMYDFHCHTEKKVFEKLQHCFETGKLEEDIYGVITEEGIVSLRGLIYQKGETLDTYLKRCGLEDKESYSPGIFGFVGSSGIELQESFFETEGIEWKKKTKEYMDSIEPDSVIVAIDCHM